MQGRREFLLSGAAALFTGKPQQTSVPEALKQSTAGRIAWVGEVLERMQSVKPGMTRKSLLAVFTNEGGFYAPLQRTFVSRDCFLFKVDVRFRAVGRPGQNADGRGTSVEDGRDVILFISKPYLQWPITD